MIDIKNIREIRNSTCALVYLPEKHESLGLKVGDTAIGRIKSEVFATGFLVDERIVLTNRHVITAINDIYKRIKTLDNIYALFTFSNKQGEFTEHFARIDKAFALVDPTGKGMLDVGIVRLISNEISEKLAIPPVEFDDLDKVVVGSDIAICGYAHGNEILENEYGLFRFGPVVHHGIISAISPFDTMNTRDITTFLTDVNTADGMSGSPVFLPNSSKVIGLHYSGVPGTLGVAIPIDKKRIDSWVHIFNEIVIKNLQNTRFRLINGGDVELID